MGTAAAIVGGSVISGYLGNKAAEEQADAARQGTAATIDEQRRQFDITQQNLAPYREAGVNALNQYQAALGGDQGQLPEFDYSGNIPEFSGGERFNYSLESDPGYKFARDQALEATERAMAAQGKRGSGNRLIALQDRASGLASQYANDAFNRQFAQSRENYGRGLGEYDIGRQIEQQQYGRSLTGYGLQAQREQDIYGRGQNYLNRLAALSGVGQTATGQTAAAGQNMANILSGAYQSNALQQGQAAQNRYGALNQAVQGGIQNYMLYNYLNPSTPAPTQYRV